MDKFLSFVRLMRPVNCFMMGFAVIVGAVLAATHFSSIDWISLSLGFLTGFMLTAASMAINDYYDRDIDLINEPSRPIPSGSISAQEALIFAFLLSTMGFIFAYLVSFFGLAISLLAWVTAVAYTTFGKSSGLLGNFLVSACVAIPFIYGSIVVINKIELIVWLFVLMAFLSNTGREITKGIVDAKGDRAQKVKTIAVRYGEKTAAIVATFFYVSAVLLTPIPWILGLVTVWFLCFVAITDLGLLVSSFLLISNYSRQSARRVKTLILFWFVIGLAAFIFGTLK